MYFVWSFYCCCCVEWISFDKWWRMRNAISIVLQPPASPCTNSMHVCVERVRFVGGIEMLVTLVLQVLAKIIWCRLETSIRISWNLQHTHVDYLSSTSLCTSQCMRAYCQYNIIICTRTNQCIRLYIHHELLFPSIVHYPAQFYFFHLESVPFGSVTHVCVCAHVVLIECKCTYRFNLVLQYLLFSLLSFCL